MFSLNIVKRLVGFHETAVLNKDRSSILCLRCCHILTDKGNGRRTDRKNAKNVYPVVKVVSVAMNVVAEGVRSA